MDTEPVALGFQCPLCGGDRHWVDAIRLPQMDVVCIDCGWEHCVEP